MKALHTLFLLMLLFGSMQSSAQETRENCTDVVYLRNGSVFRGKISEYKTGGEIVMTTWSGVTMTLPEANVKRIVQRCSSHKLQNKPYDFKEHGLYNATRLGLLIGKDYRSENATGFMLYHSTGWMFRRWIGAGVGAGVESYRPDGQDAVTYPVFAEIRGYFQAKNISPFYALGGGWGFAGNGSRDINGYTNDWSGGWMAKAQVGYRIGNNFVIYTGLSFQKKTRDWRSTWGGEWGTDRILHKRMELGLGIVL